MDGFLPFLSNTTDTGLKKLASDKHSSLFCRVVQAGEKKLYKVVTRYKCGHHTRNNLKFIKIDRFSNAKK
jgi:hypothetical protein